MLGSPASSLRQCVWYHIPADVQGRAVSLRYALSRLSRPAARRAFGRGWLGACLAGALVSLWIFGRDHLFFITAIWLLCVFAPVRIAVEVLETRGPRMRRELQRALLARPNRYTTREDVGLMVETLFAREVRLPRLALPDLESKVIDAAARVSDRAFRGGEGSAGILRALTTCTAVLQRWVGVIAAGEMTGSGWTAPAAAGPPDLPGPAAAPNGAGPPALWDPAASVQDQWVSLRAVAGLAALAKTLTAVYEDSTGTPWAGGGPLRALAEAAMDYADQVGLRLDGPAWEDIQVVPPAAVGLDLLGRLAAAWLTFCAAPAPAPRRLRAFVELLAG